MIKKWSEILNCMDSSNKKPKLSPHNKEGKEEDDDNDTLDKSMSSSSSDIESSPSLEMMALPDDCLRAVLIRICAADHDSLRQTCKRVLSILNSFVFRQERAVLGYTEVQGIKLLSGIEQYKKDHADEYDGNDDDEDKKSVSSGDSRFLNEYDELGRFGFYGQHEMDEHFRVFVDGKRIRMEAFYVQLLPRKSPFFEMCDEEAELSSLSVTCFNNRGRFRLKSLKAAVPEHDKRPLLYISQFELPKEYRSLASPVGPLLLKSLLFETLQHHWSIAMYIPCNSAQFLEHDELLRDIDHLLWDKTLSEEELKTQKAWEDRLVELITQDMRQFFRAGFHQVKDVSVIEDASSYYVFATPVSPQGTQRILSEKEALQIEILFHPPSPPKKSKEESNLFESLRNGTSYRKILVCDKDNYIQECSKPCREIELLKPQFEEMDKNLRDLEESIGTNEGMRQEFEGARERVTLLPTAQRKELLESLYDTVIGTGGYDLPPRSSLTVESLFNPILQYHDSIMEKIQAEMSTMQEHMSGVEELKNNEVAKKVAGMDEKLREHDMEVNKAVEEIFEKRARDTHQELIVKSCAIHACAYCMVGQPYIQSLLEMMPPNKRHDAINSRDEKGLTPLMVAATSGALSLFEEHRRYKMCAFLIENGANENLKTRHGLTALGIFRQYRRDVEDQYKLFGASSELQKQIEDNDAIARKLESLLKPAMGPTAADDAELSERENSDEDIDDEDSDDDPILGQQ